MNDDWQQDVQTLLKSTQVAFLSTMGETSPETSMCPYAVFNGDIILHLSSLAKHSKNIQNHKQVGLIICTPENKAVSPLALARISFTGKIEPVTEVKRIAYQDAYLNHVPDAQPLFTFPDFTLYRIQVAEIKWVGGFGKARKIPLETWKSIC
ncbi:MAG: pyridoxamine 5'-phosphate oxidase family protein [Ghiorsea sp.]